MQTFYKVCLILMIIGGINWGLVGLFQFDFAEIHVLCILPDLCDFNGGNRIVCE